jgi:hypothetical protein
MTIRQSIYDKLTRKLTILMYLTGILAEVKLSLKTGTRYDTCV